MLHIIEYPALYVHPEMSHSPASHAWIHMTVLEIYLSVGKDTDLEKKKKEGAKWLFPFLNLSSVSSFILFVLLFLYGREDNLQAHKMPATTNVDPINLFVFKKYIYNVGKSEGRPLGEREALIFGMFICMCVCTCICLCTRVYTHISRMSLSKIDVSCGSLPSLYNVHICIHTHLSV